MATDTLTHATAHAHEHGHHDAGELKIFGFWIYLMSDCILFSILFATYAVLAMHRKAARQVRHFRTAVRSG